MTVIIDVVGSFILAAMVILAVNTGVSDLNQASYEQTFTINVQTNLVSLARVIEFDFVKIGFRAPQPAVTYADSQTLEFQSELYDDGVLRTVRYSVSTSTDSSVTGTSNPDDFMLYREVTGEPPLGISAGLVGFTMTYFDSLGSQTTVATDIKSVHVRIDLETTEPVDSLYPGVFWVKTIYPRNL